MKDDISIVLSGEAGQGLKTVETVLTSIVKLAEYNVFSTKEYMSRVRGGINSTSIRVASFPVFAYIDRIDFLIPLDKGRTKHLSKRIGENTTILGEKINIDEKCGPGLCNMVEVNYNALALEAGNKLFSNIAAVGVICGILGIDQSIIEKAVGAHFFQKDKAIIEGNFAAASRGRELGENLLKTGKVKAEIKKDDRVKAHMTCNGAEAVGLGALAGGCNFICAYPMTPATPVLHFLAEQSLKFDIVVEQAEDEISGMNMAIGAWYAGARAMASSAGGGYALMVEGLSLAAMIESPLVVHLSQRPAPATGLPTRTEQADLNFALYSGHGEFPRVILAPGSVEDAFFLTQKAFNLADKYQVPVFLLTDQYLMDSYYNLAPFDLSQTKVEPQIEETKSDYLRYKLTESGISSRGIPGWGQGMVCVDSDEHDETGHITEDLELRAKMVDKRQKKLAALQAEIIAPEFMGASGYKYLIIGWGSTYPIIKEACQRLKNNKVAFLHFKQLYPLHPSTTGYLKKAKKIILVENNATAQFGQLIKLHTGFQVKQSILKYDGLPFSVEEIEKKIKELI